MYGFSLSGDAQWFFIFFAAPDAIFPYKWHHDVECFDVVRYDAITRQIIQMRAICRESRERPGNAERGNAQPATFRRILIYVYISKKKKKKAGGACSRKRNGNALSLYRTDTTLYISFQLIPLYKSIRLTISVMPNVLLLHIDFFLSPSFPLTFPQSCT